MLGMGREDEDVDTEVGTGGCEESELSNSDLRITAPDSVNMATFPGEPVCSLARRILLRE